MAHGGNITTGTMGFTRLTYTIDGHEFHPALFRKNDIVDTPCTKKHGMIDCFFHQKWFLMHLIGQPLELVHELGLFYCNYGMTLKEQLESEHMPFDVQLLRIKFVAEMSTYQLKCRFSDEDAGKLYGGHSVSRTAHKVPLEWRVDKPAPIDGA